MKAQTNPAGGFTIVELLVGIVVSFIVIGSLSQVVTNFISIAQRGRYLNLANSYVEGKIEAIRNTGYNVLPIGTSDLTSELTSQIPPNGKSASMTVTNPQTGLKQVVITVSYRDQGHLNTYNYTTYVGELGVGQ